MLEEMGQVNKTNNNTLSTVQKIRGIIVDGIAQMSVSFLTFGLRSYASEMIKYSIINYWAPKTEEEKKAAALYGGIIGEAAAMTYTAITHAVLSFSLAKYIKRKWGGLSITPNDGVSGLKKEVTDYIFNDTPIVSAFATTHGMRVFLLNSTGIAKSIVESVANASYRLAATTVGGFLAGMLASASKMFLPAMISSLKERLGYGEYKPYKYQVSQPLKSTETFGQYMNSQGLQKLLDPKFLQDQVFTRLVGGWLSVLTSKFIPGGPSSVKGATGTVKLLSLGWFPGRRFVILLTNYLRSFTKNSHSPDLESGQNFVVDAAAEPLISADDKPVDEDGDEFFDAEDGSESSSKASSDAAAEPSISADDKPVDEDGDEFFDAEDGSESSSKLSSDAAAEPSISADADLVSANGEPVASLQADESNAQLSNDEVLEMLSNAPEPPKGFPTVSNSRKTKTKKGKAKVRCSRSLENNCSSDNDIDNEKNIEGTDIKKGFNQEILSPEWSEPIQFREGVPYYTDKATGQISEPMDIEDVKGLPISEEDLAQLRASNFNGTAELNPEGDLEFEEQTPQNQFDLLPDTMETGTNLDLPSGSVTGEVGSSKVMGSAITSTPVDALIDSESMIESVMELMGPEAAVMEVGNVIFTSEEVDNLWHDNSQSSAVKTYETAKIVMSNLSLFDALLFDFLDFLGEKAYHKQLESLNKETGDYDYVSILRETWHNFASNQLLIRGDGTEETRDAYLLHTATAGDLTMQEKLVINEHGVSVKKDLNGFGKIKTGSILSLKQTGVMWLNAMVGRPIPYKIVETKNGETWAARSIAAIFDQGSQTISATDYSDYVMTGSGDDILNLGAGADVGDAGVGIDTAKFKALPVARVNETVRVKKSEDRIVYRVYLEKGNSYKFDVINTDGDESQNSPAIMGMYAGEQLFGDLSDEYAGEDGGGYISLPELQTAYLGPFYRSSTNTELMTYKSPGKFKTKTALVELDVYQLGQWTGETFEIYTYGTDNRKIVLTQRVFKDFDEWDKDDRHLINIDKGYPYQKVAIHRFKFKVPVVNGRVELKFGHNSDRPTSMLKTMKIGLDNIRIRDLVADEGELIDSVVYGNTDPDRDSPTAAPEASTANVKSSFFSPLVEQIG